MEFVGPVAQVLDFNCYRPGLFPEWDQVFIFNLDSYGFKSGLLILTKFIDHLVSTLYAQFSCLAQVCTTL